MTCMHLGYSESTYKGHTSRTYRICRSFRDDQGRPRKQTLFSLGALSDEQAAQIRQILRTAGDPSYVLCRLDEVLPIVSLEYLDLAVAAALWDEHRLSHAFGKGKTISAVSTPLVAKVLTINRCVSPCSHYAIEEWLGHTALPEMLGFDPKQFNDDKLFYELDKIYACKRDLEDHLFSYTYLSARQEGAAGSAAGCLRWFGHRLSRREWDPTPRTGGRGIHLSADRQVRIETFQDHPNLFCSSTVVTVVPSSEAGASVWRPSPIVFCSSTWRTVGVLKPRRDLPLKCYHCAGAGHPNQSTHQFDPTPSVASQKTCLPCLPTCLPTGRQARTMPVCACPRRRPKTRYLSALSADLSADRQAGDRRVQSFPTKLRGRPGVGLPVPTLFREVTVGLASHPPSMMVDYQACLPTGREEDNHFFLPCLPTGRDGKPTPSQLTRLIPLIRLLQKHKLY